MSTLYSSLGPWNKISITVLFSPVELEYPSQYFRIECIIMTNILGMSTKQSEPEWGTAYCLLEEGAGYNQGYIQLKDRS